MPALSAFAPLRQKNFLMKNFTLNIAGYTIRFESPDQGPDLIPAKRFSKFIINPEEVNSRLTGRDVTIAVRLGDFNLPSSASCVFHAPFVEEIEGIRRERFSDFWSVWKHGTELFIKTVFPLSEKEKKATLKFSLDSNHWDLWITGSPEQTDPLEYPLDGLILYYLSVINGDIMIHASGVEDAGKGYVFSGVSGKGKSTLAGLWNRNGAKVIHDDRLIIRKSSEGYYMYNTPVYDNEVPSGSPANRIYIIEHGMENRITPVKGANAVSLVMANCIQHNWGPAIVSGLLESVSELCRKVPVYRLSFKPDKSVINHILEYE